MSSTMRRLCESVRSWVNCHHVKIVVLLSLVHIGLSCMHSRESGTLDLT